MDNKQRTRRNSVDKTAKDKDNQNTKRRRDSHSFYSLLHDEEKRKSFHDFLCKEHSEENLDFWTSCQQFKRFSTPTAIRFYARAIYSEFIAESAKSEVNLVQNQKTKIKLMMNSPTSDMFDEANREIEQLMKKDSYRRYLDEMKDYSKDPED